jgi:transcriptional regulator with XRE-family HTH domain
MTQSVFSSQYDQLRNLLISARKQKGLTQENVAARLGRPQSFVSKYERGERRLDVVEFLQVTKVLEVDPDFIISNIEQASLKERFPQPDDILSRWEITSSDLTKLLDQNPSLRGMLLGYVAEFKIEELWLKHPEITDCFKYDNHDRRGKEDRVIVYQGEEFIIEVKSLQTNTIRYEGERWTARAQVDASDRREVSLPDGSKLSTTCLLVGEFDVLAVNILAFEDKWRFIFAKNKDLPRSNYSRYTPYQREHLLASTVQVTWPPVPPFRDNLFDVLDELVRERLQERTG